MHWSAERCDDGDLRLKRARGLVQREIINEYESKSRDERLRTGHPIYDL
jgi:hypothetical protein